MTVEDIEFIDYCRLLFSYNVDAANQELERIAGECAALDVEHPQQWFSFFADKKYLKKIAAEVYDVYEREICVGDRYTKPDLPVGMVVDRYERDSVEVKYRLNSVHRAIREPMP